MGLKNTIVGIMISLVVIKSGAAVYDEEFSGKKLFDESCASCHGQKVINYGWPGLFGMKEKYFSKQMKDYRSKLRIDHRLPYGGMNYYVEDWSDGQIAEVATYLESRNLCQMTKNQNINPRGGDIRLGSLLSEEHECLECHDSESKAPLAGQLTVYMSRQLKDYKLGNRTHRTMQKLASRLSEKDMLDVSAYINSLTTCK